jgi:hypothetical protein
MKFEYTFEGNHHKDVDLSVMSQSCLKARISRQISFSKELIAASA